MGMLTPHAHQTTLPPLTPLLLSVQKICALYFHHFITLFFCLKSQIRISTILPEPRRAAPHDLTLAHKLGIEL
jgi:hypothetical protein